MCVQLLKDNILFDENCDSRILYLEEKDEEIVQISGDGVDLIPIYEFFSTRADQAGWAKKTEGIH